MKFLVITWETVEGRYEVEANSEEEAHSKFENPRIDWDGVEQLDYQAFDLEIHSVTTSHLTS